MGSFGGGEEGERTKVLEMTRRTETTIRNTRRCSRGRQKSTSTHLPLRSYQVPSSILRCLEIGDYKPVSFLVKLVHLSRRTHNTATHLSVRAISSNAAIHIMIGPLNRPYWSNGSVTWVLSRKWYINSGQTWTTLGKTGHDLMLVAVYTPSTHRP